MERFETRVVDGDYVIEVQDGWIEIGSMDEIVDDLGEIYVIEYDDNEAAVPWLKTDDGELRIEVREQLLELSFDEEFVNTLAKTPVDQRVDVFTSLIGTIWSAKGDIEQS